MVDGPALRVRVMTWNIWWRFGPRWRDRQPGLMDTLRTVDPAVDGPLPVIVTGDLNAAPDSPVLRPLRDALVDAWTAGAGDPEAATIPSSHPSAPVEAEELIDRRIDHIFLRPGQPRQRLVVESAGLAGAAVGGLYPSDHRAVVCDVSWTAS